MEIEHAHGCPGWAGRRCGCGAEMAQRIAVCRLAACRWAWAERFSEVLSEMLRMEIASDTLIGRTLAIFDCDVPGFPHRMKIDTVLGETWMEFSDGRCYRADEYDDRIGVWSVRHQLSARAVAMLKIVADKARLIDEYLADFPRPTIQ